MTNTEITAAGDYSSSGMIALIPTAGNAQRLAVENGELADDLHVTLLYLGDISDIDEETVSHLMHAVGEVADENPMPVVADGFNVALFNPQSDERETCVTLGLSGVGLHELYQRVHERVLERIASQSYDIPEQHDPWIPHVTLAYSDDHSLVEQLADRTGDITFDRLRLALGDDIYDLFLTPGGPGEDWDDDDEVGRDVAEEEEDILATGALHAEVDQVTTMEYNDRGGEEMAAETETETDGIEIDVAESTAEPGAWSGILIVEGVESGDGRMFAEGSLKSAPLPLPLMWQQQTDEGHKTAVQVGRIDELWREGNEIWGSGVFDLEGDDGQEAYRQVAGGFLRGVSGDVDSVKDSDVELIFPKTMGSGDDELADLFAAPELTIFHRGRLRGATLVQFPAFVEASISLDGAGLVDEVIEVDAGPATEFSTLDINERVNAEAEVEVELLRTDSDADETLGHIAERDELTACGCTDEAPPRSHFEDPKLAGPTPPTLTADGRYFGHAAIWGTCHTGFAGTCVTPPRERGHEYFLLGETLCADGSTVATGAITLGTGHASTGMGFSSATSPTACIR